MDDLEVKVIKRGNDTLLVFPDEFPITENHNNFSLDEAVTAPLIDDQGSNTVSLLKLRKGIVGEKGYSHLSKSYVLPVIGAASCVVAALGVSACTSNVPLVCELGTKDVEFFLGKTNFSSCTPATGQMAFNYYGVYKSQEEIAQYVLQDHPKGYYFLLDEYAKSLGFNSYNLDISISQLEKEICSGKLAAVGKKFSITDHRQHSVLVHSCKPDQEKFIYHDPAIGPNQEISYQELLDLTLSRFSDKVVTVVIWR